MKTLTLQTWYLEPTSPEALLPCSTCNLVYIGQAEFILYKNIILEQNTNSAFMTIVEGKSLKAQTGKKLMDVKNILNELNSFWYGTIC